MRDTDHQVPRKGVASGDLPLFQPAPSLPPYEGQRDASAMHARLSRQCQAILSRLEAGSCTNRDLADLCLKYTCRVSELRQAGYVIECYDRDAATGVCWYRLVPKVRRQ